MKKVIFSILLVSGLLGFFVPLIMISVFHMDYDAMINNDVVAFLICLASVYLIVGACIGLYRISDRFKAVLKVIGQCLIWWI